MKGSLGLRGVGGVDICLGWIREAVGRGGERCIVLGLGYGVWAG